ncbi:MAG: MFS transporter [Acidimicrobiia bacterium]|nr:MFS transporter [Acidimicrobiia bacterium]
MSQVRQLYFIVCAAMFVLGTVTGLPGALFAMPEVVERLQLTLADRGGLIAALFAGLGVGSAVSGPIAELIGSRRLLAWACALVAVCFSLTALASSYPGGAAALAALGVAAAGLNTAANVLVSNAFPGERGRRLNAISIAVAAGGLAMPLAAAGLAGRVSWRVLVVGASTLAAIVAVTTLRIHAPASATPAHLTLAAAARILRQPGFAAVIMLVLLGAANDVTMAGWTSTYLLGQGFTAQGAAWALASYWFGLIAGRLALSRYVDRDKELAIAMAGGACGICTLALVLVSRPAVLAVLPFLAGASIALLVPTALALGGERFSANAGMAFGVMMTAAQVGAMALPALVGVVAEAAGLRPAMGLLVISSLVSAGVALLARSRRTPPSRP